MIPVALSTEDALSEAVGLKLLAEHPVLFQLEPMLLRKGGFGYLRSRMPSWRQMAAQQVVFVLTDLDSTPCPIALLTDWLGEDRDCPPNLLLRIAVRETESWLLADQSAIESLIGRRGRIPIAPDDLLDPKAYLLQLAKKAPKKIREDLVAQDGANARQGIGYNSRLIHWVETQWSPKKAADRSPSLFRARLALLDLASRLT